MEGFPWEETPEALFPEMTDWKTLGKARRCLRMFRPPKVSGNTLLKTLKFPSFNIRFGGILLEKIMTCLKILGSNPYVQKSKKFFVIFLSLKTSHKKLNV